MKRTRGNKSQTKKASAVLCADLHLRPDSPIARTDNFQEAMWGKVDFIIDLAKRHDCPLIVAGDLGHRPGVQNWPFKLQTTAMEKFSQVQTILIPGQHDLQNHSLELIEESGVSVLWQDKAIKITLDEMLFRDFCLCAFPWGKSIEKPPSVGSGLPIVAVAHITVIENRKLWPDQKAPTGHELLKQHPEYSLILVGDNHISFTSEIDGRYLVNPGSMMRSAANQIDHEPQVYLWYAKENQIESIPIPIKQGVISRDHIDQRQERDNQFVAFVRQKKEIEQRGELSLSYTDNMKIYLSQIRIRKPVKDRITEAVV